MNPQEAKKIIDTIGINTVSTHEFKKILLFIIENENSRGCYIHIGDVKSIHLSLCMEKYSTLLYTQGERFLKGLLAYYQQEEKYEKCTKIIAAIEQHNSFDNDNKLSTDII